MRWSLLFFLCSSCLLWACSDSSGEEDVSIGCRLNSDCAQDEACVDGQCQEDLDVCVGPGCPCLVNTDCATGQGCEPQTGECFDLECVVDNDCQLGDVCSGGLCETDVEADRDKDGVPDNEDNCSESANADQEDNDLDGQGDACDVDDDNDAVPDSVDNCVVAANPVQGDADADGQGNACDEDAGNIEVRGVLDFSARPAALSSGAQVFISGRQTPATIDENGVFVFEEALTEPGRFLITVEWAEFAPVFREFEAPDNVVSMALDPIVLTPAVEAGSGVELRATALLEGAQRHENIVVEARSNGALVGSAPTTSSGNFVLSLAPVNHTLRFSKAGFEALEVEAIFETQGELAGEFTIDSVPVTEAALVLAALPTATLTGTLTSPLEIDDWPARTLAVLVGEGIQRIATVSNSNGDGLFEVAGLTPGDYTLSVQVFGHLPVSQGVEVNADGLNLDPIALTPSEVVFSGVVIDGALPIEGVAARARRGEILADTTLSDVEGNFSLRLTAERHTLTLNKAGFETHPEVTLEWNGQGFEVVSPVPGEPPFVMEANPVATLRAEVSSSQGPRNDWPNIAFATLDDGRGRRIVGLDNANEGRGQFQFVALAPGAHTLTVNAQGHGTFSVAIVLEEGENVLDDISLEAQSQDAATILQGRVRLQGEGEHGDSSGVLVRASVQGNTVTTSQTAVDGVFAFLASRQDHTLSFTKENYLPREVEVVWNEAQERFELSGLALGDAVVDLSLQAQSDLDFDGFIDALDNCPRTFNFDQEDTDGDGLGDACDRDIDGDNVANNMDNCPQSFNPMQEDEVGTGLGAVCTVGSLEKPIFVGCGVENQHLDTRGRADRLQGSCGGANAPELVYELGINEGEEWDVRVEGRFSRVTYLIDARGSEVACAVGGQLRLRGLEAGHYRLVVDGFDGPDNSGKVDVSVRSEQACAVTFEDATSFELTSNPGDVASGDIDNDGHADIVVINRSSGLVSVMLGDGLGGLAPAENFAAGTNPLGVDIADIDLDGNLDLAIASTGDNQVNILLGDGQGGFVQGETLDVGQTPLGVKVADFNSDGRPDIASTNATGVSVALADDQTFSPPSSFTMGQGASSLAVGDLDHDGHQDLVKANLILDDVSVRLGDGQGGFGPLVSLSVGDDPSSVALADFNSDGHLDIVTSNLTSNDISVLVGDGSGGFEPQQTFSIMTFILSHGPSHVTVADANGDGQLDVLTSNFLRNDVSMLLGDGQGGFGSPKAFSVGLNPVFVAMTDLDADGRPDLVTADQGALNLSVRLNDRRHHLDAPRAFTMGDGPTAVALGDLNKDGLLDIITANGGNFEGTIRSEVSVRLAQSARSFGPPRTFPAGRGPTSVALGDVNRDGHLDAVTADNGSLFAPGDTISVLLGDGRGAFALPVSFNVGNFPRSVALGDLNNDEKLDIAVANAGTDDVSILLGDGLGGFIPGQAVAADNGPTFVELSDLDGDENLDIVAVNTFSNTLSVNLGSGQGDFSAPLTFAAGNRPTALTVGEINGDGIPDAVVANTGNPQALEPGNTVSVFYGNGQGGFAANQPLETDSVPTSVDLGDINQDGHLDIVTVNNFGFSASVLLGDGQGGFAPQRSLPLIDEPNVLRVRDADQDGLADIIIANNSRDSFSVLYGRRFAQVGTRRVNASLPPCPTTSAHLTDSGDFSFAPAQPCRIDRLELAASTPLPAGARLGVTSAALHQFEVLGATDHLDEALLRPEVFAALARVESHPLGGQWKLDAQNASPAPGELSMLVNSPPVDPFDPETRAEPCTSQLDQVVEADFVCRLEGDALSGAEIDEADDEDVFLLEGAFDGAFIRGQVISATVSAAPGAQLFVELRAHRARAAVAFAEEVEPGVWTLEWTVSPQFSGRYFSVHVRADTPNLIYNLTASSD